MKISYDAGNRTFKRDLPTIGGGAVSFLGGGLIAEQNAHDFAELKHNLARNTASSRRLKRHLVSKGILGASLMAAGIGVGLYGVARAYRDRSRDKKKRRDIMKKFPVRGSP